MFNQAKNNNLKHLIDTTFTIVNRLLVLSYENENDRTSFSKYYVVKIEMKDFNVLVDSESFFDVPIKNKKESYEQIVEMTRNSSGNGKICNKKMVCY